MRAIFTRLGWFYAPGPLLAVAFGLLLLGAGAAITCFTAAQSAAAWSRHTLRVGLALDRAQILAMRAEINRRGYVMTGDTGQRAAYLEAARGVDDAVDALAEMVTDNPAQRANIARLRGLLDGRLSDMAAAVKLRDAGHADAATELTRSSRSAIGVAIAAQNRVRREEQRLLDRREAQTASLQQWGLIAFAGCTLLLVLAAWLVWHERRERIDALSDANRDLAIDMRLRAQAEAQLEMLAANATDAVVRTTLDGACLYASPSAQEVFGVPSSWLIGRALPGLVMAEDRGAVGAALARMAIGDSERELATFRQRRGGRWLEASSRLVRDPLTGAPAEVIAAVRDVTTRKALEIELQAARHRAEDAAAAKAGFLANMSHEIRTPMNGVLGFTDLVLAGELSAEQRRHMELIAESGRAMMRLLNDILDLSKIESGSMRIADETVDLRHVLKRCVGLMAPVAQQKNLALTASVDDAVPARLAGDPLRVRQILLNLIGNAVKFTEVGAVTVTAAVTGDRLRVAVRDTGIGIPADKLPHVFEQFTQAESSTARRFGGSGLGLSISAELARLMGGTIAVDSAFGYGSTFTLELPLRPVEAGEAPESSPMPEAAAIPAGAPARVLIAEDHEINQELIGAMARRVGAEPTIAADGAQAVAMAEAAAAAGTPYAMILMDMQMPEMNGIEATRALRARGFDAEALPIVALTANAFADDIQACLDAGMQAHLAKPVSIEALAAIVARFARSPAPVPAKPKAVKISPGLQERYRARKQATIAALDALMTGSGDDAARDAAADELHKLAGTAAMFGEPAVGEQAHVLEHGLAGWLAKGDAARIRAAIDRLRQAG